MIYNFLIKATKGKYASCSLYYTEIRGRYISFLHSRRINRLAVLCFVTTETIGKGEANGAISGVFTAQILTSPLVFGSNHHRPKEIVAVEIEDGITLAESIAEIEVEIA